MTPSPRQVWLEREMRAEEVLRAMRQGALDHGWVLSYREAQEIAAAIVPTLAALVDAPLRELEEALKEIEQRGIHVEWGLKTFIRVALARLPWREET